MAQGSVTTAGAAECATFGPTTTSLLQCTAPSSADVCMGNETDFPPWGLLPPAAWGPATASSGTSILHEPGPPVELRALGGGTGLGRFQGMAYGSEHFTSSGTAIRTSTPDLWR